MTSKVVIATILCVAMMGSAPAIQGCATVPGRSVATDDLSKRIGCLWCYDLTVAFQRA